ncbi:MAG: DUF4293 domain-containing protein [Rikenellaceae bacterium]|nr:DUF4293 domain-containing protein [Rikenellaceae bacterium]
MIQRKQTLWLLLAAAVLIPRWFMPYASIIAGEEECQIYVRGLMNVTTGEMVDATMRFVILIFATLVPVLSIFFYKHRKAQLEFCISNIILCVVIAGLIVVDWNAFRKPIEGSDIHAFKLSLIAVVPLLSMAMNYLAYRRIMYDELLIKSLDRIR